MNILLTAGYLTTTLLGSFCPMQMAAAMPMANDSLRHEEMSMNMTPLMPPMTPAVLMSVAPTVGHRSHASMPVFPSGDCTVGHCIMMDHAGPQNVAVTAAALQVLGGTTLPAAPPPLLISLDSLPAPPPKAGDALLAQTITTIVLRM